MTPVQGSWLPKPGCFIAAGHVPEFPFLIRVPAKGTLSFGPREGDTRNLSPFNAEHPPLGSKRAVVQTPFYSHKAARM